MAQISLLLISRYRSRVSSVENDGDVDNASCARRHSSLGEGRKNLIHRKTSRNSFASTHRRKVRANVGARYHADVLPESVSLCKVNRDLSCAANTLKRAKWYNKSSSIDAKIYFTLNANAHATSHWCNVMPSFLTALTPYSLAVHEWKGTCSNRRRYTAPKGTHLSLPLTRWTSFGSRIFHFDFVFFPLRCRYILRCHLSGTENKFPNMIQSPF